MTESIAEVVIPDSALVREATELVRSATDDLLFNHSRRAYSWVCCMAAAAVWCRIPNCSYVAAMFHDLGLNRKYRRTDQRFELDGADAARTFLLEHRYSQRKRRDRLRPRDRGST